MKNYRAELSGTSLPDRIDKALVKAFPLFSRRQIRRCLDAGGVYLNQRRVRVSSRLVFAGDTVDIAMPGEKDLPSHEVKLSATDIVYQDQEVVVVNKPPGLPSQPTRTQAVTHLKAQVEALLPTIKHLKIVHRLDLETSGAMILAKNDLAAAFLMQQFKSKAVDKEYLALCRGIPQWQSHKKQNYLLPIAKDLGTVAVAATQSKKAKLAVTQFTVIATARNYPISLLKCVPITGRSHQIRVHLQQLGLPVLGDKKYGDMKTDLPLGVLDLTTQHHLLHADKISFRTALQREKIRVDAQIPRNFGKLLGILSIKRPT